MWSIPNEDEYWERRRGGIGKIQGHSEGMAYGTRTSLYMRTETYSWMAKSRRLKRTGLSDGRTVRK